MNESSVVVTLEKQRKVAKIEGHRIAFSPHLCFTFDSGEEDLRCLRALKTYLTFQPGLALFGTGRFLDYLLTHGPEIRSHALYVIPSGPNDLESSGKIHGISVTTLATLPPEVKTVFICETMAFPRMEMRRRVPSGVRVIDCTILSEIAREVIPKRAWTPIEKNIYPVGVPEIKFKTGLDLILIDCPSRNLALMPNGLGYVNNALKDTSVSYQIFDLDIVAYHRFHIHRLFDLGGRVVLPSGRVLPEDPWQAEHYDVWTSASEMATNRTGHSDVLEFFRPIIDETIDALVAAKPKILGLSIQQCNEAISREIVRGVQSKLPEIVVVVGGFSCYNADIGRRVFPECDYMCVGESDLTVGLLMESLARGERPFNQPGVLSRYDTPDYRFIPAPMVHNLDQIEFPRYEWGDLGTYRNYNDYQLTPIIASRGCRWSRCTFCAERFYWRIRSPENFVDELEWLVDQGCYLFMFNESDLNGMPEKVMEICDEIIRRGLHRKVKLTGQLRIHKKSNRAFFEKLRAANFVALRFGVDAFSENTLRLQKKGYTVEMLSQNLRDCWEAGIYTEVNWVIGVPGETEDDVEEGITLILKNRKYIGRLANINPLILVNGGVYWLDPEAHNIKFREPREQLYAKYPRALPADAWYSVNPYIDAQVRKERFERIVMALHEAGFPVGPWAAKIIEDVNLARDPNRAGGGMDPEQALAAREEQKSAEPLRSFNESTDSRHLAGVESESDSACTLDADEMTQGKPAATPPLYRIAGDSPRLIRKLESHDVLFFNGWYYGVPHGLTDFDVTDPEKPVTAGIIKHTSEEQVIALIEEASYWANTRGQYDAQERQQVAASYMRVDSALGETVTQSLPEKMRILPFNEGVFIAVDADAIESAFKPGHFGLFERKVEPLKIDARSPLRRLATKLPPILQHRIRRILRVQSYRQGSVGGLVTQPDGRLMAMLWRGTIDAYVKRPLSAIFKGEHKHPPRAVENRKVDGEDFSIISVVTKNALPELMWSMDGYNVVKYDGLFFGLPHGFPVDWENDQVASIPGVFVAKTVREVVGMIEGGIQIAEKSQARHASATQASGPAGEATHVPILMGSLEGYNIVSYEGWVYGISQALGPIDLTEVDPIGMPGVIRDVSRDVVENEIMDRVKFNEQSAA